MGDSRFPDSPKGESMRRRQCELSLGVNVPPGMARGTRFIEQNIETPGPALWQQFAKGVTRTNAREGDLQEET
jgi:hypothetical protein